MASSDLEGEVSASTRKSPDAPAEGPVERPTVQETERVSDRVHKRHTDSVALSLLLQHTTLGEKLGQFPLKAGLKQHLLGQH